MAAGVAHIPFYATGLRADELAGALSGAVGVARKYRATSWSVQRQIEDAYSLRVVVAFDDKKDWELFWNGAEMQRFRAQYSGLYQVPIMYAWYEVVTEEPAKAASSEDEAAEDEAPAEAEAPANSESVEA